MGRAIGGSLWVWVCVMFFVGCALRNQGEVSFRLVRPGDESNDNLRGHFQLMPVPAESVVREGDAVAMTLQQVFVADFFEVGRRSRGEIAVLADVREIGGAFDGLDGDAGNERQVMFDDASAMSARVIYFSRDVARDGNRAKPQPPRVAGEGDMGGAGGQYLNFSALPMYGPAEYGGGPLLVRLFVLELDEAESQRFRLLFDVLASAGARWYPPSAPVLGLLNRLGGAMLSQSTNDWELDATFVLHPFVAGNGVSQAYLQEGNFVVVKRDHVRRSRSLSSQGSATGEIPWDRLRFDGNRQRLVVRDDAGRESDYRDHTYLVLRLTKRQRVGSGDVGTGYPTLGQGSPDWIGGGR